MKKQAQIWIGIALAAALLYFMFRGTDWGEVWAAASAADPIWLAVCMVLAVLSFFTRVQRWSYIVRSVKPVSYRAMFSATQIGFLANFTLPGRVGEAIRAYVLGRLARMPFTQCFAFVALDRVTDLVGLLVMMVVAVLAFRPTGDIVLPAELLETPLSATVIRTGAYATMLLLAAVVGSFVALYFGQGPVLRIMRRILGEGALATRLLGLMQHFADGLHIFRHTADLLRALLWSLITWGMGAAAYLSILYAFGVSPPWYAPFVIISLLSIVISMPGAPGFVGQFHFAVMVSVLVVVPDVPLNTARAMAIVCHLANFIPILVVGFYCVYREDFGLLQLRREGARIEEAVLEEETQAGK